MISINLHNSVLRYCLVVLIACLASLPFVISTAYAQSSVDDSVAPLVNLLPGFSDEDADDPEKVRGRIVCKDYDLDTRNFTLIIDGEASEGIFAAPASQPDTLVVVAHGYGHGTASWQNKAISLAQELGVLAVVMNYRGNNAVITGDPSKDFHDDEQQIPRTRGWPVRKGAQDLDAAARLFQKKCPSLSRTILLGVSMGANVSGYSLAHRPVRKNGAPLYDYWIPVEGVHNVIETYLEGKSIGHDSATDIEVETGGTYVDRPDEYERRTNFMRGEDVGESGLTRVIYVHAAYDGLIPYWQSRLMQDALDLPYEFYTVARQSSGEDGTPPEDHLLDNDKLRPLGFDQIESPLAGHASDKSDIHIVLRVALNRIRDLVYGLPIACGEYLVDESTADDGSAGAEAIAVNTYAC